MKNSSLYFFVILFLAGCSSNNSEQKPELPDIYGEWYMVEYFDSAVANKKIYDYSNELASIAFRIAIKRQSYEFLGSVGYIDSAYIDGFHEVWNDTISRIDKYNYQVGGIDGYHIKLSFVDNGNGLTLFASGHNPSNKQDKNPKTYEFRKIKNINNIEQYFAKNIFEGKYYDSLNNRKIILGEDLSLIGMDSVDSYSINIETWDAPQMDIISFSKKGTKDEKMFKWELKNNKLILYNVTSTIESDGDINFVDNKAGEVAYRWIKENNQ